MGMQSVPGVRQKNLPTQNKDQGRGVKIDNATINSAGARRDKKALNIKKSRVVGRGGESGDQQGGRCENTKSNRKILPRR